MAWEFTYEIKLVVSSDKYTLDELAKRLLPLEPTPRKTSKGTHAAWERRFALVLKPKDSYDRFDREFADELQNAVELMIPLKGKLLELSEAANVWFIVRIFTGGHAVFEFEQELFSTLNNL